MTQEILDLKELKKILDVPYPRAGGTLFARLLNEDDPDGPVVIEDENGNMRWMMPRADYEAIMGGNDGNTRRV